MGFTPNLESKKVTAMAPYAFPHNEKFKTLISIKKIKASVFWDTKGILLVDPMSHGATYNSAAYCDNLTPLRRAFQSKRRGMLSRDVCLLHDITRPHCTHVTTALLEQFKWDILGHPPYSPELAPSDFHLLLNLKKHLAGKIFDDDDEVQGGIHDVVQRAGGKIL
jgi:histone-lysine N-methyltransferase SETMAR